MVDNIQIFVKFLFTFVAPWYFLGHVNSKLFNTTPIPTMIMALLHYSSIIIIILELVVPNLAYVGLTVYFGFVAYCTSIRAEVRQQSSINGNMVEDFFASLFMYPCVAVQLYDHVNHFRNKTQTDGSAVEPSYSVAIV